MTSKARVKKTSSIWLTDEGKKSIISVRVAAMNMQGTGSTGFFMFKKETFQTMYTLECQIANFRWSVTKTFSDFEELFHTIHSNPFISSKKKLMCPLPDREDGSSTDVMVLLERKEQLDRFIQEVVSQLDVFLYTPLGKYINLFSSIVPLTGKLVCLQRSIRRFLGKVNLNMTLLQFYSEELTLLTYALEDGVEVIAYELIQPQEDPVPDSPTGTSDVSLSPSPSISPLTVVQEKFLLWLDVSPDDPALSRLCLVKESVLDAYKHRHGKSKVRHDDRMSERLTDRMSNNRGSIHGSARKPRGYTGLDDEDQRLSKGIYMADVAEIRHGANSFVFRYVAAADRKAPGKDILDPSLCFSIIGSERTMDLQLVSGDFPKLFKDTDVVGGKRVGGSVNLHGTKIQLPPMTWRDFMVDFLNLCSIHALYEDELMLRNRKWIRYAVLEKMGSIPRHVNPSLAEKYASVPSSLHSSSHFRLVKRKCVEGEKVTKLLKNSIIIDEELFSMEQGSYMLSKRLHYKVAQTASPETGQLELFGLFVEDPDENTHVSTRMIYMNDLSEIRPGKMSFAVDGDEYPLSLTIVGSETIITLPVNSLQLRDRLITRFQGMMENLKRAPRGDSGYLIYSAPNNVSGAIVQRSEIGPDSATSVFESESVTPISGSGKSARLKVRRSITMLRSSDGVSRGSNPDLLSTSPPSPKTVGSATPVSRFSTRSSNSNSAGRNSNNMLEEDY